MTNRSAPRRPTLWAVLLLAGGIVLHRFVPTSPAFCIILVMVLLLAAWTAHRLMPARAWAVILLIASALVATGVAAADLDTWYFPRDHIALFAGADPRLAQIEVTVDDAPRRSSDPRRPHIPPRTTFPATVRRVRTWTGWIDACGGIRVSIAEPVQIAGAGQRVSLVGMLQRPAPAMNPGQFDWAGYYRNQRVLAQVHVPHACDVRVLDAPRRSTWALLPSLRGAARSALLRGTPAGDDVDGALLAALVLGERGPALRGVEEDFRRTGASHLLASSGLRVGILAAFLYLICRFLCVPPRMTVVIVTLAVVLLGLLMWPTPQAIRPVLLTAALGLAILGRRGVDSMQLLALAALLILLVNPQDLYGAGFQLSFITVGGMMLLTRPLLEFLRAWEDPDRRAARGLLNVGWQQRARWRLWDMARDTFAAALVAWLVSLPLVAYHFEQFNPWAIPVGVLLSPLVFLSLIGGFLKMALTLAFSPGASVWSMLALAPVSGLRHAVHAMAKLPFADVPVTAPAPWKIWLYYALLAAPLLGASPRLQEFAARTAARVRLPSWLRRPWVWARRSSPMAGCLLILWTPLRAATHPPEHDRALRVTLLSLGAGQCAVVETPDGRASLIDAGSSTLADVSQTCLGPFLRHEGRGRIDRIFLSHGDYDHISAAQDAVREYGVAEVLLSPHFRRHANESGTARALINYLDHHGRAPRLVCRGERIDLGSGAVIDVLWPPAESPFNSNNTGLVLRLSYDGRSILFPADIQDDAERALLRNPAQLASDVIVAPHHGSAEAMTGPFLAAVHPASVLSSNAARLSTKQRRFEQIESPLPLYRTPRCGAITVTIAPGAPLRINSFLASAPAGNPSDPLLVPDDEP